MLQNSPLSPTHKLGASKYKKLLVFDETWYSGVFEIADYESELKI